mmetsp:Transcript_5813/g.6702  ORF Transcript_5813/g.6702 Transcript_5813/m.6702 type:complete len:273 (+) Transcript_5813:297-1115(+)
MTMSQFPLPPQLAVQGYTIVQQSDGEVQPHFVVAPNQPYTVSYVQTPGVVPYYPAPYQQGVNSLLAHPPQTQAVSWSVGPVGGQNLQLQTAKPFKVLQASSSAPIAVGNSSATVRQVSRSSTVSSSSKRPLSHQPEKKARKRKRKVCQHEGCSKVSQGKTPFCLSHGGGYRCKWKGCSNGARGKSGFCITHGGGKLCKHKGCKTAARGQSNLCICHGGGKRCQFPKCTKSAQGATNLCKRHGGGKRCRFAGCRVSAKGRSDFCTRHARELES